MEVNRQQKKTISELRLQLAVFNAKKSGTSTISTDYNITDDIADTEVLLNVQKLGRWYGLFFCMHIDKNTICVAVPTFGPTDAIRYASAENMRAGEVADLFHAIPNDYFRAMADPEFPRYNSTYWKEVCK